MSVCDGGEQHVQVSDAGAALDETILNPQIPLMLRNPGFLFFSCAALSLSEEETVENTEIKDRA